MLQCFSAPTNPFSVESHARHISQQKEPRRVPRQIKYLESKTQPPDDELIIISPESCCIAVDDHELKSQQLRKFRSSSLTLLTTKDRSHFGGLKGIGPLQLMQGEIFYFTASQGLHNFSSLAIQLLSEGRTRRSWRERLETHVLNRNLDLQDAEIIDSQVVIDEGRPNGLHSFQA